MTTCMLLSIVLLLDGCSSSGPVARPESPRAAVAAYFAAVGTHHWGRADTLLSPAMQRVAATAPDSDRANTVSVTDVNVQVLPAPFARGDYPGYSDIEQALVTFDAIVSA